MRGAVLTCQMAGVSKGRPLRSSIAPCLENTGIDFLREKLPGLCSLFYSPVLHLQWVIAQIALSSLSHLLWNKSKYRAQRLFSRCKTCKFLLLEPPAYMAVPSLGLTSFIIAEYSREPTLSNQINLPTLSSPSESSGPHTTIHSAGKHLVILLAMSLVKYLSSQTWKRLVHLKA